MRLSILAVLCLVILVQNSQSKTKVLKITNNYFCIKGGWKLVFVGVAGNGESFVDRWQEKHNHHCCELHKGCLRLGISHFFFGFKPKKHLRSPLIDHWKKLNVRRVKIELYKDKIRKGYMIFNGLKSNMNNWFSKSRLLSSSFYDLNSRTKTNFFSFKGYSHRKMYINRNFGGCNAAYGWFMVTENNTGCRWDYYRRPYPQFLFGKGRGVRWNSLRFENANYMGIWIQLY